MKQIKFKLTLMVMFVATSIVAQIQHGGTPYQWKNKSVDLKAIPFVETEELNMEEVRAADAVTDQYKETPYRFGIDFDVDYDVFELGSEDILPNGDKIWRLGIHCPKATSINFIFSEYDLPAGATVYIWNADRSDYIGSLTNQNNKGFHRLAIGLIHSDRVIIEYQEPAQVEGEAKLTIGQISHGYRPVINKWKADKGPFGNSGSCNMNVNCDDGQPWQDEKRGVALIINGGFAHCTGSLINNTNQDGTPYFLTAHHCDANESNWVFYFNHEYEGCSNSGIAPTNQTVSGATELATTAPSDGHLIQLSSDVPASYNPYFCGWDNSGDAVSSGVGIHHPSGDVKKISFDDDPLTITTYFGTTPGDFDHWRIEAWERGTTTEPGSSGSPLFDQNHRIIGQLHGGTAACGNSIDDYYGAFHVSFPYFSQWLDPNNSGVSTLDGYGPYDIVYSNDAQAVGITNLPNFTCSVDPFDPVFELKNNGTTTLTSATINYSYNGIAQTSVSWTGTLAQNESVDIPLVTFNPINGNNTIEVNVDNALDENAINNTSSIVFSGESSAAAGVGEINIHIQPDNYGSETTWVLNDGNGTEVLSGGPYTDNDTTPIDETYDVPAGVSDCFEFIIMDEYGDGICCAYGEGSYQLTDADGAILAEGGEFDSDESKLLSISSGVGIDDIKILNQIRIFPNPATDYISIETADIFDDYQVRLVNLVGQEVLVLEQIKGNTRLDVSKFVKGVYFIEVKTALGTKTQRVLVN